MKVFKKNLMRVGVFVLFLGMRLPVALAENEVPHAVEQDVWSDEEDGWDSAHDAAAVSEADHEMSEEASPAVTGETGDFEFADDWWLPEKPYDLWEEDQLEDWLKALEEHKKELEATGGDPQDILSINKQVTNVKRTLSRFVFRKKELSETLST